MMVDNRAEPCMEPAVQPASCRYPALRHSLYHTCDIDAERAAQEEESKNLGSVLSQEIKWKQEAQIKASEAEKKLSVEQERWEHDFGEIRNDVAAERAVRETDDLTKARLLGLLQDANKKFADDLQNKIEDYGKKYCSNEISMLSECNKNFRILAQERDSLKEALKAYQEGKACSCPNCPDRKVDGE